MNSFRHPPFAIRHVVRAGGFGSAFLPSLVRPFAAGPVLVLGEVMGGAMKTLLALAVVLAATVPSTAALSECSLVREEIFHGGGLNRCGCHFNARPAIATAIRREVVGCPCQPAGCKG
jgi:hypothetical protein